MERNLGWSFRPATSLTIALETSAGRRLLGPTALAPGTLNGLGNLGFGGRDGETRRSVSRAGRAGTARASTISDVPRWCGLAGPTAVIQCARTCTVQEESNLASTPEDANARQTSPTLLKQQPLPRIRSTSATDPASLARKDVPLAEYTHPARPLRDRPRRVGRQGTALRSVLTFSLILSFDVVGDVGVVCEDSVPVPSHAKSTERTQLQQSASGLSTCTTTTHPLSICTRCTATSR